MTDDTARMAVFEPYGPAWNAKHCKQSRHQRLQDAVDQIRRLCDDLDACAVFDPDGYPEAVYIAPILAVLERLEGRR